MGFAAAMDSRSRVAAELLGTRLTLDAAPGFSAPVTVPCTTKRLDPSKLPSSAPDGAGGNLDALDARSFSLAARLLPGGPPAELTTGSWLGRSYTIVQVDPEPVGGGVAGYVLLCYRTPVPPTANTGTADGTRKDYWPPPTTL